MPEAGAERLRCVGSMRPFQVALLEPEIPQNTGSIARLCAATGSTLHLIGRLGFRVDEKAVRRAGLDYWHLVEVRQHTDLEAFAAECPQDTWRLYSAKAERSFLEAPLSGGEALLFGKESVGLPDDVVRAHGPHVYGIPTSGAVRSINLSNAVGVVLFDAIRRVGGLEGAQLR